MSVLGAIRENWRVGVLVVLLALSAVSLFASGGLGGNVQTSGPTNLQYGIQLDGGARIRAPVVGLTASDVPVPADNRSAVEQAVAENLDLQPVDVTIRLNRADSNTGPTVEVFSKNVAKAEFANALQREGFDVTTQDIRRGVTEATRQEMVQVISQKLNAAGLSGGSVTSAHVPGTDQYFIVVEAPNRDVQELQNLISRRGVVRVVAYYPRNGTYHNATVLRQGDFASIDPATVTDKLGPHVPVTLRDEAAQRFANEMVKYGFSNGATCRFTGYGSMNASDPVPPGEPKYNACLLTIRDGEVVYSAGVAPDLGQSFQSGEFVKQPQFVMQTETREEARQLSIDLRAGALPAPLNFSAKTTYSLQPALAQRFKTNSLIVGLVAVLAVSLVVYARYRDVRVAAPMVVTALSEVFLLLGFSAAIQYPLDLSVIAGFIAVIGTGVDDLVIIADEVMAEGEVSSSRVFRSRFRQAFWVIGAAAATTIIAMSPLAVLSLGDLQGFAIVTILGVLIGVLITRPAYGDILRTLLTDR